MFNAAKIDKDRYRGLLVTIGITLAVGIMYVAKPVILPIVTAIVLSFLLAPAIIKLQKLGLPKSVAIIVITTLAFSSFAGVGWTVAQQAVNLAAQLPKYEATLRLKVKAFSGAHGEGSMSKASKMVDSLSEALDDDGSEDVNLAEKKPMLVTIAPEPTSTMETAIEIASPMLKPIGNTFLVVLLAVVILFQREDLRERFIKTASAGRLNVATEAIDDAAKRVSKFLVTQLFVNVVYGIPVALGLYFIGIPNAPLWGAVVIALRFIPYLGTWIAAIGPLLLSLALEHGWWMFGLTLGLYAIMEMIICNVVEPWLYGLSTGTSNFSLMVAALFWTWLWGPVGLLLSTPLTVCIVVLGNYLPSLNHFTVLLGSAPALKPWQRLYQRMLAMDYDEMLTLAKQYRKEHSFVETCDDIIIPALSAAKADIQSGELAEVRHSFLLQNTLELVDDLVDQESQKICTTGLETQVLIIPARDDLDEVSATIFKRVLHQQGISATVIEVRKKPAEFLAEREAENVEVICISAVPPNAMVPARRLIGKIVNENKFEKVIACFWSPDAKCTELETQLGKVAKVSVLNRLSEACDKVDSYLSNQITDSSMDAPIPAGEKDRLKEVNRLRLLRSEPVELFDEITRTLASTFDVPISLVTIVDSDRQFWRSHVGLPKDLALARQAPRDTSVCGHVVAQNNVLIVEDIAKDPRFANNQFLKSRGIRFYAGVPLRTQSGHAVGSLCVIDTKPRKVAEHELNLIKLLAEQLMSEVEKQTNNVDSESINGG